MKIINHDHFMCQLILKKYWFYEIILNQKIALVLFDIIIRSDRVRFEQAYLWYSCNSYWPL